MHGLRSTLGIVVIIGLIGCDPAEPVEDPLDDREFVSQNVEGSSLVPGTNILLRFHDGELSAYAGCNSMGAAYSVTADRLEIGDDDFSTTEAGCAPPFHEQDEWLAEFLQSDPELVIDEPRITLRSDEVAITLIDTTAGGPHLPLQGTRWELSGFIDGDTFAFGEWPLTVLEFAEDGTFSTAEGCPRVSGRYAAQPWLLYLSDVDFDTSSCPSDEPGWVDLATAVLEDGETTFTIDSTSMKLERGDQGLQFTGS